MVILAFIQKDRCCDCGSIQENTKKHPTVVDGLPFCDFFDQSQSYTDLYG